VLRNNCATAEAVMGMALLDGNQIRKARKAKGLTLDDLAKLIGSSKIAISRWENGKSRPREAVALRLEEWLSRNAASGGSSQSDRYMRNGMTVQEWRAPTQPLAIKVPMKLIESAADDGLDLAKLFETVGTEAVRNTLADEWKRRNADAIKAWNEELEKNGLPLEKYRMF
jgi:antitoxin CcdA